MEIRKLKTWGCACGYRQDFEPTEENMRKHKFFSLACPSCKNEAGLSRITDPDKKIKVLIPEDTDIDKEDITDKEKADKKAKRDAEVTKLANNLEDA